MKLTAFLLVIGCLHVSAKGLSQEVNLSLTNAPLETVLQEIKKQSGYKFFYEGKVVAAAKPVTINIRKASIDQVLTLCFKDQPLTYTIIEKTVVIKAAEKKADDPVVTPPPPGIDVSGKVVNEKGEPVAGASITVKGVTGKGTSADENGLFILRGVDENATLVISGVNIETREIKVEGKTSLTIATITKVAEGEEVVVKTNYFSTTKRLSTANIAKVTAKEIGNQPVTSPLLALQGRVTGLEISMPENATPGAAPIIRIRGYNSLRIDGKTTREGVNDGNLPLYVIDGVPVDSRPMMTFQNSYSLAVGGYDPISTINPANIESIEILKDADATAIYGTRGANGVILITTKHNTKGNELTNIDLNFYKGIGRIAKRMQLLNAEQYISMRQEALANSGPLVADEDADLKYWDQTRNTDWQDLLLGGAAEIDDIQVGVSFRSKNTSFRIGGGFHNETLIFPGDFGYQRFSGLVNINHISANQRFRLSINSNFGIENNNIFFGGNGAVVSAALSLPPIAPNIYNADGSLNWEIHSIAGRPRNTWDNPLASRENRQNANTHNFVVNASIGYDLFGGFSLQASMGYTDLAAKGKTASPSTSQSPTVGPNARIASFSDTRRGTWIIEPKILYKKRISQHSLDIVLGGTLQKATNYYSNIFGESYSSDLLLNSLKAAGKVTVYADDFNESKYLSAYGRIGYNWKEKYLLNLTVRRDGSSRFAPGNQFGNFGAVGIGWIFSEESKMRESYPVLSFGKLRGSFGLTGNDAAGDYLFYNMYNILPGVYNGERGFVPNGLFNNDFAWETTGKLELGLELGFLKNSIGLEASWYRNRSSNQLVDYTLPSTTGFPSVYKNFNALVQNTGFETIIWAKPIESKNWRWNISLNISAPRNKLIRFDGIESSPYADKFAIGAPITVQLLYKWIGVNSQTGLHEFEDINHDGIINNLDKVLMNNPADKKYYGGFNNTIRYKNIEVSVLFQFSKQSGPRYMLGMPGSYGMNQPTQVLDRWFAPGDRTDIQRFDIFPFASPPLASISFSNAQLSTYNKQDASFIRLKSLSINYTLPQAVVKRLRLQQTSFFIQGQNLLTLTRYYGLDPETGNGLPPLLMITGGIQVRL